jgi:hypothetical protein
MRLGIVINTGGGIGSFLKLKPGDPVRILRTYTEGGEAFARVVNGWSGKSRTVFASRIKELRLMKE